MKDRKEVILAGTGGQGLVTCGKLLSDAAILEGKNVVQTQSYGDAQRGGMSQSQIIIDANEIVFFKVQKPDVILAISESAIKSHTEGNILVPVFYDNTVLTAHDDKNLYGFPFTQMAEKLGNVGAANVIALGAIIELTGIVKPESMEMAIKQHFKTSVQELNIEAMHMGMSLIQKSM